MEQRHEDEVRAAEEKAKKQVVEENPDVDAAIFDINFSDVVKTDDQRRKQMNPGPPGHRAPQRMFWQLPARRCDAIR